MKNTTQKFFQVIALTSFSLGLYNTLNTYKVKQIREELNKERIKNNEIQSCLNKNNEQLESIKEQNNTILENIKELIDSSTKDGSSNLISSNYLDSLQHFFDSLSFEQTLAITNISGSIAILFSLFTITTIFYGEYFISYFKLEDKFPKIAKFIQIRRSFQKYSLLLNYLLIIIILIGIIYINILVLL
jgi:hypothetical protein